ncbi:MAG TPA: HAMP domain-containing sensor histidine kinase [Rhizomicrobium sp.]|nr:HAMP domain-containing sensor histidine kinase [Rhizomicrobium sp.]
MAQGSTAFWPIDAVTGFAGHAARLASKNIKLTVVVSVVLICGAFAAASALQMRFDRVHALNQATYFEQQRAHDIAAVVANNLDRIEMQGRVFAADPLARQAGVGVRNIAVYDEAGFATATLTGTTAFVNLPPDVVAAARSRNLLIAGSGIATAVFARGGNIIAVAFDSASLAPPALLDKAAIQTSQGVVIMGAASSQMIQERVNGWPVIVSTATDDAGALGAWYGSLPLYLFVILGPAIVGAGLAALFVGEFERRAKATAAVKALRSTKPEDAKLLVRLAQAERDVIEARRSRAEFVSHMSHELRTPLNAVIGFSEIIERGMFGAVGNSKYIEYARDIGIAGRGLHAKIGDILEFANLEAGRYPLKTAQFDLAELAHSVVEEHVGRAFSRRIALDMTPSAPVTIHTDPQAVRRILVALLTNALAFTPEGGRVIVSLATRDEAIVLTVADNGPGFQRHEAAQAGNAFRRFDRQGGKTGSGLGLAIAMSLAARLGGALKLFSAPDKGTRTDLWLRR